MNSNQKGKRGERELAKYLSTKGFESKRGQQFCGGSDSPDVISTLPFHIECKRTERINLYDALEQATNDCQGNKPPIVIHRKNNKPWVIIMTLDDFINTQPIKEN